MVTQRTLAQDARALAKLRERKTAAQKKADELKDEFERAQRKLIERMEMEEVKSITTGDTRFSYAETVFGQIQDREAFVEWAKQHDDSLIESRERKGLINELVRERLDNGEELPPGVGHYVREYISHNAA